MGDGFLGNDAVMDKTNLKKRNTVIIAIGFVGLIVLALFLFGINTNKKTASTSFLPIVAPTEAPMKGEPLKTIEDEWGFRLSYADTLSAKAATKSGELTRWELSDRGYDAKISVWTAPTDFTSISEWVEGDEEAQKAEATLDTTLGGKEAKKLRFANNDKLWIAAVDHGQLFVLEQAPADDQAMSKNFTVLANTFEFIAFEGEDNINSETIPQGSDVVDEGEEAVE